MTCNLQKDFIRTGLDKQQGMKTMDENLRFSVITVCYNEEKTIQKTMESVLKQSWDNFEYIIVDGGSEDATIPIVMDYAAKDPRIRWYSEKDKGIYDAMNKGIRYAEGDFLYFLNAGDLFYDAQVLKAAANVIEQSRAEIVIGKIIQDHGAGRVIHSYPVDCLREDLSRRKIVCHQTIVASRESLKSGFEERYTICADYDWLCRQVNAQRRIAKLEHIIAVYDSSGISSQAQYRRILIEESMEIAFKNFPQEALIDYKTQEKLLIQESKNRALYNILNQWLRLRQRGIELYSYFTARGTRSVAIYGFHMLGQRLYDDLKDSPVRVLYAIDKKPAENDWEIPVYHPEDPLEAVDMIVITPIFDTLEIKRSLARKLDCNMISIEEILIEKSRER